LKEIIKENGDLQYNSSTFLKINKYNSSTCHSHNTQSSIKKD